MSYEGDEKERVLGVATYVHRILQGASPADLPVQQPKRFQCVVNLRTAKQIGVTIPPNVFVQAKRLIN